MTDLTKLKELAAQYIANPSGAGGEDSAFRAAANPQAILGLLERLEKAEQHWANENSNNMALIAEVERLRARLEIDERTPYDGIACRDETIKGLDEKCDRLKAENTTLQAALIEAVRVVAKTDPEGTAAWLAALEGGGK